MIEAIVFDFDGLILDTETPEFVSWQEIFSSYGVTLERRIWDGFIGSGFGAFDVCAHLAELSGKRIDRDVVRPLMRSRYLRRIEQNPLLPGVEDCIVRAKQLGLKLAVASSSRRGWATGHLERRGLLHNFEFVLCGDDVSNVKPDPELYDTAVRTLGVQPQNAIAIEDSSHGLRAAKGAGLRCVVVPNPMTERMAFDGADMRLNSLSDLTLDAILDALNGETASVPAPHTTQQAQSAL